MRSSKEQADLLETAGFTRIVVIDVTKAFIETARRWLSDASGLERELRGTLGDALFDEQQADRKETITAIEQGLLRRSLFVGTRPH